MRKYRIAVVPGDGIGVDTVNEAVKALLTICQVHGGLDLSFDEYPWGCEYYLEHGEMMPPDALGILEDYDSILFGAAGFPSVPDHISQGLLMKQRRWLALALCHGTHTRQVPGQTVGSTYQEMTRAHSRIADL